MTEDPTNVMESRLRELELAGRVIESVLLSSEERLMGMHARAVDSENRLRHERRMEPVFERYVTDDEPEGGDIIRGC